MWWLDNQMETSARSEKKEPTKKVSDSYRMMYPDIEKRCEGENDILINKDRNKEKHAKF